MAAALTQGLVAAALSWQCRQDAWWPPIHFLFPAAITGAMHVAVTKEFFLAGFILFAALYWTTFRTRVPYYPSGKKVWRTLVQSLPSGELTVADVGSGMGGLVLHVARARSDTHCLGIEAAPLPWLVSRVHAWLQASTCRFKWGRYESVDFSGFDVVFAYLSPAAMPALWQQARAQMRPGSLLFSFEFPITAAPEPMTIVVPEESAVLYCWRM